MNKELEVYYEERFSMMASQGWKDLMEDIESMVKTTDTLTGVTPETLQFKQGELSIMRWLLSLKESSETAYEELKNENNA